MSNIPVKQRKKSVRKNKRQELISFVSSILERLLERDRFFDAESAKNLGLIDKVLEHPIQDMQLEDEKQSKS
jgi:ATP-dependent protease ClpP protease subunit